MRFPEAFRRHWGKFTVLLALLAFTLSLHYMLLPVPHSVHLLHRRLCYVPIILGALWFGARGGLGVAGLISVAVLPLALKQGGPLWGNEELVEIIFYLGIGGLAGFLVDRGERERDKKRNLERELEEAERLASAGRTAAGIAHEVRTPLASIQGSVEILAEDFPPDHARRPYFDILAQEAHRLKRVMDDFLDLNRPISIVHTPVEVAPFLEECAASLRSEAGPKGVVLDVVTHGTLRASMDPARIRQVMTNLLRNAVQACGDGGAVRVAGEAQGTDLVLAVEDDGPGLSEEDLGRIFEPFFTKKREGVGLGLSLARQIAAAHGGTLDASNRREGGARFTLRIPLERS